MRGYIPYKDYKALHFPGYLTITFVRHAAPHRSLKPMDEIQKSEKCVKSVGAYANAYAF